MEERKRNLLRLKHFIGKLQKCLTLLLPSSSSPHLSGNELDDEFDHDAHIVPDDVKEGHFAVLAVEGGEAKRFVIELEHLTNPAFLKLLKQAEEEYGFSQKGTLAVPCRPEELCRILSGRRQKSGCGRSWGWTTFPITIF